MKAGGRACYGTGNRRIHILIALGVFGRVGSFYIRRQGHMTVAFEPRFVQFGPRKFKNAEFRSFVFGAFDDGTDCAVGKAVAVPRALFFCVFYHSAPQFFRFLVETVF